MSDLYMQEIIAPGDKASVLAKDISYGSFDNNQAVEIRPRQSGNFRGPVDIIFKKHILEMMLDGKMFVVNENDGAGGKPDFATFLGTESAFYNLSWEVLCMILDDIARNGGFPVFMDNDVNAKFVNENNFHLVEAMFKGFGSALKLSNVINKTGEFAIMKYGVTAFCDRKDANQLILNWSGSCVGLGHEDKNLDGSKIESGMPIVGFWEPGYRCNGGTQLIDTILYAFGGSVGNAMRNKEAINFVKKIVEPSVSYAKLINRAHGWNNDGSIRKAEVEIAGIAHITGGGIWNKFKEILPSGVGAHLDKMGKPAEVLLEAQELTWNNQRLHLSDWRCHSTFHGGYGMLVVCKDNDASAKLIELARREMIIAEEIGITTKSDKNEILIQSQFKQKKEISSEHSE